MGKYQTKGERIRRTFERACETFGYRCAYCGRSDVMLHREHMMPTSRGGGDEIENIVPACQGCNVRKRDMTPLEWFLVRNGMWQYFGKTYRDLRLTPDDVDKRPTAARIKWLAMQNSTSTKC